jgi:hypothetical protein
VKVPVCEEDFGTAAGVDTGALTGAGALTVAGDCTLTGGLITAGAFSVIGTDCWFGAENAKLQTCEGKLAFVVAMSDVCEERSVVDEGGKGFHVCIVSCGISP